jgi:D-alanyl-D-alanine carboxypeptidase
MGGRLKQALDSRRWTGTIRREWREFAARRGLDVNKPPRVAVSGGVGVDGEVATGELLVVHRSKPLVDTLRRFNCFSNNDIERVTEHLGPIEELVGLLAVRCGLPSEAIQLETTSGLGTNRLTPKAVVRLLHEFRHTCERVGVPVESVLPVAGCDSGTVTRFFPLLSTGEFVTSVVGKTGTLTSTDGGIAVLAGFAATASGEVAFCVAAPRAGGRLKTARSAEERWVLDLIAKQGGPAGRTCAAALPEPDTGATMILVAGG